MDEEWIESNIYLFWLLFTNVDGQWCRKYERELCSVRRRQNGYRAFLNSHTLGTGWPVYEVKFLCSRGWEWGREGATATSFNIWSLWYEDLVIQVWLASKCQDFKHSGLQFHFIYGWITSIPTLRTCHFEAIS